MNYLLDTQVFIWAMEKSTRFSKAFQKVISDPNNMVFVSVATVWEIIIKKRKGLKVPRDIAGGIKKSLFTILPINIDHVLEIEVLEDYHKDPFDRIIIAQAKVEKLTLITVDEKILKYHIKALKA
ncbi:type II toxin-antitoxin system VapC family toxin [Candidatus Microgenomates bacterium]|nr:type II toxin-antitoxin system VapC family toxin [Candidatus Microgenomates bacterium]